MLNLPRGAFRGHRGVPLGTADWESPPGIERMAFAGGKALFLGAIPYASAWPKIADLAVGLDRAVQRVDGSTLPPLQRAAAVRHLDALWEATQLADCVPLGTEDDRHFVTIAGARSGKGRSAIIPNLCLYPGSVVVLDPKGENASLTAARRGPGNEWCAGLQQSVYVLDPFGVADVPDGMRASLNPLALLKKDSPLIVDDAALLAEGLVVPGPSEDTHWTETARNIIQGIILHLVSTHERASLFDLRAMLTRGDVEGFKKARNEREKLAESLGLKSDAEDERLDRIVPDYIANAFDFLLWSMSENMAFEGVVMGAAESLISTGPNERGSTLSTARRNTAFLDTLGPRFKDTLSGTTRPLEPDQLKDSREGITVYLCLPAERMKTHGRWMRMMIGLFLERMQRNLSKPKSGVPVLFLLEEFFALGPMASIEKAAGYAAGFGVKLWAILQDLQQLVALYPTSWQTFLANAGAVQVFGASDQATLGYMSMALGEFEISRTTETEQKNVTEGTGEGSALERYGPAASTGLQNRASGIWLALLRGSLSNVSKTANVTHSHNKNEGLHVFPLLRPDEIALQFSRESGAQLLLIKGRRPVWALRVDYDRSPWFQGYFTPLQDDRENHSPGQEPRDFWHRSVDPFTPLVERFNALVTTIDVAEGKGPPEGGPG